AWKRGDLPGAAQRLLVAGLLAVAGMIASWAMTGPGPWLAPIGIGIGLWVVAGALSEIAWRSRLFSVSFGDSLRRAAGLPRSAWGTMLAHLGVGVMVIGITATSAWREEHILSMTPGQSDSVAGYDLKFSGVSGRLGPNYRELVARFDVTAGGSPVATLEPSKRNYVAPRQVTSEAGIHAAWSGDLYAVLGDELKDGAYAVRIYFNPLVRLIWIGSIIMFIGGMVSLSDRRLRVGAPRRATTRVAVPAE
ncbi:MAG: cytochrome c-type biogenesis CcmF C-terminal domain-containing protein, partial [Hyphomicrobiales bacterium]